MVLQPGQAGPGFNYNGPTKKLIGLGWSKMSVSQTGQGLEILAHETSNIETVTTEN